MSTAKAVTAMHWFMFLIGCLITDGAHAWSARNVRKYPAVYRNTVQTNYCNFVVYNKHNVYISFQMK